jgi:hypothetical protein
MLAAPRSFAAPLALSLAFFAGARPALAQTPAPVPPPPATAAPPPAAAPATPAPAEAPPPEATPAVPAAPVTESPASEAPASAGASTEVSSGGGLFEQAQADAAAESGSEAGGISALFDLNGYVRGDFYIGKMAGANPWETKAAYGELALKVKTKKFAYGDAFAEARVRYGNLGYQTPQFYDITENYVEEEVGTEVELREAYVNTYVGPLDLRVGQQIVVWGRADAFNPTNNVTPFDLTVRSPVEDDRRVGNVGARAFLNFEPFRIEGVWMPLYKPAELPIPVPDFATVTDVYLPDARLQNGTEGARVHLELSSFEMSVSYLYGYAPLPGLALGKVTPGVNRPIEIARTAYNQHVVGADFSTAIGDILGLRAEAAFRSPLHYENRYYAPNPDVQYVLGADHTFGSVSVIAQYMGRYVLDWTKKTITVLPVGDDQLNNLKGDELYKTPQGETAAAMAVAPVVSELTVRNQMLFNQLHEIQHSASVRIEWLTAHDTLSLSAFGFMNFSTEEWLVFPKLGYQISDQMSTSIGAEIYGGPTGTLFGVIDAELSAGYAELRYSF